MNNYDYSTAADYARITGYHRTTIVERIKCGEISVVNKCGKKENPKRRWRISHKAMRRAQPEKPYPKHYARWTATEDYVLINNYGKPICILAEMLGRNANSVRIRLCRLRKDRILCGIISKPDPPMLVKRSVDAGMVEEYKKELHTIQCETERVKAEHKTSGTSYRSTRDSRYFALKSAERNLMFALDSMLK